MWSKILRLGLLAAISLMVAPNEVCAQQPANATASVTLTPPNPPVAGSIAGNVTWANCSPNNTVTITVSQVTAAKPRRTRLLNTLPQILNAGPNGTSAIVFNNLTSGDTVIVTVTVTDANGNSISGSSYDTVVP
jgi:hypothetical protein